MSAKREYITAVQAVCNPVVFSKLRDRILYKDSHFLTLRVSVASEM